MTHPNRPSLVDGFSAWQAANGEHVTTTIDGEEVVDFDAAAEEIARDVHEHYTAQALLAAALDLANEIETGVIGDVEKFLDAAEAYRKAVDVR